MITLLAAAIAYVLGAIPFGYVLVKWTTGRDVRSGGSGNIGATNVMRTTGRAAGIGTLLLDVGKGYLAVWIAGRLSEQNVTAMCVAALAVMAGHAYPVFLRFKGGKAVASFIGAFLCLTPVALGAVLVVFVVVVAWTPLHLDGVGGQCGDLSSGGVVDEQRSRYARDGCDCGGIHYLQA